VEGAVIVTTWRVALHTELLSIDLGPQNFFRWLFKVILENLEVDVVGLSWDNSDVTSVTLSSSRGGISSCLVNMLSDSRVGVNLSDGATRCSEL
jgi:hypothetical protein